MPGVNELDLTSRTINAILPQEESQSFARLCDVAAANWSVVDHAFHHRYVEKIAGVLSSWTTDELRQIVARTGQVR